MKKPLYSIVPSVTPLPSKAPQGVPPVRVENEVEAPASPSHARSRTAPSPSARPFLRAENEDDDGYDPYSDRPADPDPIDAEDPWR